MRELLPDREDAKRLASQVFLLSEFLNDRHVPYPQLHRKALVHAHCHHHSVMKFDAEEQALRSMGLTFEVLDSGCCGMAGSFGFERDHYDISMKVGERVLLPAVRRAPKDVLIVADGFSCRTQIAQSTNRRALHLAELIEMGRV
jgi:Fe-S oxidoreductase